MRDYPGGGWGGPSTIGTGGAGFGFQVGGQVTEFVIILNTQAAVEAFARGGNLEFAGALSVAAGPVGRAAEAGFFRSRLFTPTVEARGYSPAHLW